MTISSYLIALLLTLIIELAAAYALGFRDKKSLISIICVNTISHPIFCYFLWIGAALFSINFNYFSIIVLEIIIAFSEAILLFFALKRNFLTMLKLSIAMNLASFVTGLLIF